MIKDADFIPNEKEKPTFGVISICTPLIGFYYIVQADTSKS